MAICTSVVQRLEAFVRPSGTEPKLKFYYGVKGTDAKDAEVKEKELGQYMINLVNSML